MNYFCCYLFALCHLDDRRDLHQKLPDMIALMKISPYGRNDSKVEMTEKTKQKNPAEMISAGFFIR